MARIDSMFRYLKENGGSDLHLAASNKPHIRKHGSVVVLPGWEVLSDADLQSLLREIDLSQSSLSGP